MEKQRISPRLMDAKQVYEYCGRQIGIKRIRSLMKQGLIETIRFGGNGKLVANRESVDRWLNLLFNIPIKNEVMESIPTKLIGKTGTEIKGITKNYLIKKSLKAGA